MSRQDKNEEPLLEEGIIFLGIDFFLVGPFLAFMERRERVSTKWDNPHYLSPCLPTLKWHSLAYLSRSLSLSLSLSFKLSVCL
jgi:hypothetical protein